MNDPAPLALASVPSAPADPSLLTLHLDICRMRAELELLETRIGRIRASEAEAAADTRPFVDRAQDLVDRTVESLYETGRAEIEAIDRQSRLDAESRLAEASRHAQELLAAAREELADALIERAESAARVQAPTADVVILPDEGLIVLPGHELVVLPDAGLIVLPRDDVVLGDDVRAGSDVLEPASAEVILLPGEDVVVVLPEHEEPAEAAAPGTDTVVEAAPALDTVVEAAPVVDEVESVEAATSVEAPPAPSTGSTSLPTLGSSWAATEVQPAPASSGLETDRANAAFDVWLAMAPPVPEVADLEQIEAVSAGRPGWLRAIEAIAVLLFVALVVAAGLYIIG
jgi:hypothetical protein